MISDAGAPLSWNLVADVRQLFAYHFMVNAFWAGTVVAVVAALVGWFMVLRGQTFAGHTLAVVGFPGAAGATLLGAGATWGYFSSCSAAALVIAILPRSGRRGYSEESAVIGTVQAFALSCGFLFVTLYAGSLNSVNSLLFGSFLGIADRQVVVLATMAALALATLGLIARPLLFASVDPDVAAARGVPVRALSAGFLLLLALTVAAVSQITGTLLVFALLVMPSATAQLLTARPARSAAGAVAIAVSVTWAALAFAYYSPYPMGFYVTSFAFAAYVAAQGLAALAPRRPRVSP